MEIMSELLKIAKLLKIATVFFYKFCYCGYRLPSRLEWTSDEGNARRSKSSQCGNYQGRRCCRYSRYFLGKSSLPCAGPGTRSHELGVKGIKNTATMVRLGLFHRFMSGVTKRDLNYFKGDLYCRVPEIRLHSTGNEISALVLFDGACFYFRPRWSLSVIVP